MLLLSGGAAQSWYAAEEKKAISKSKLERNTCVRSTLRPETSFGKHLKLERLMARETPERW